METGKLYYEDPKMTRFEAEVISCTPEGALWAIVTDRTAFYPEGGGQPADHGQLGGVPVADVREKDGVIRHLTQAPLPEGARVTGCVDRERRLDHTQQHSGEHVVSGLICARFGCDNVGFHISENTVTIDFNASVSREQLWEIEDAANERIRRDLPVRIFWPDAAALEALEYRSKKALSGAVRIVEFPETDRCACCGTHVERTGEIGLIKLLSADPHRGGTRIEMVCGERALRYVRRITEEAHRAAVALSVKPSQLSAAVLRLKEESRQRQERAAALEKKAAAELALRLTGAGDVLLTAEDLSADGARRLADAVGAVCGGVCGVFAEEAGTLRYVFLQESGSLRALARDLNVAFDGRGGGRDDFVQGSLRADSAQASQRVRAFFPQIRLVKV